MEKIQIWSFPPNSAPKSTVNNHLCSTKLGWVVERPDQWKSTMTLSAPGSVGRTWHCSESLCPGVPCGPLRIGNSKTSPKDYAAISPLHRTEMEQILSKGCSTGLFASLNSSCSPGLGTGGMSSVRQLSRWQFPATYRTFCKHSGAVQQCLLGGSLLSDACLCKPLGWHCCSVAWHLAFTWHLLLGILRTKAGMHLEPSIIACRNQVPGPSSLHPCSAGDRGLQGMLKTASSFFWLRLSSCPTELLGFPLKNDCYDLILWEPGRHTKMG